MTEILTESFCERCGTRYTFESAAPRKTRMGRMRTVSKGLRNYVLQDESSLSEAMADARSEEERNATSHQLDAFHKTFNFCMTCRQYTCGNCWNTAEGRCLTCSPVPGSELPPIVLAEAIAPSAIPATNGAAAAGELEAWPEVDQRPPEGWPEEDLTPDRLARAMGLAAAAEIAEPEAPDAPGVLGVAPGQSLEDALAEYEAQIAAEEDAELEAIEAAAADEAVEDVQVAAIAEAVEAEPDVAEVAGAVEVEAEALEVEAAAAEALDVVETIEAEPPAAEVDEDLPLAAAAALGAAAVVASDDEPAIADVEAKDDHGIAKTLAAGALAAAAWPVDDDEPMFTREPQREEREPEPEPVAAAAEPEPEPVAAAAEPAPEPEPVAAFAEPDPEPEPVAAFAEPEPEPERVIEPETIAAAAALAAATDESARDDVVVQPTWPIDGTAAAAAPEAPAPVAPAPAPEPVAPVQPPTPTPAPVPAPEPVSPWLTVAPDDGSQPEWPAAAAAYGRTPGRTDVPMTLAGRQLMPRDDAAALWAASAREVLSAGPATGPAAVAAPVVAAPQPCVSCGLSLSANARFCRRCGTRQG